MFKYLFIHLFIFGRAGSCLVALLEELRSLFSPVVSRGYSLAAAHRLLTVVEPGSWACMLSRCGAEV